MSPLSALIAADTPEFDPNSVTPGVLGFVATILVMAVVVLLVIDMVRRVRRNQYRAEIGERLDAEEAAAAEPNADPSAQSSLEVNDTDRRDDDAPGGATEKS